MWQRFLRNTQAQLSRIMIFRKTFSKSKLLFQILPINRKLLKGNSFRRTHHATLSSCKTRLMIHSIRLTTRSTLSTHFFTRSTCFSTRSTRFSTSSTRLSTCSICLYTHSTRSAICWSFNHRSLLITNRTTLWLGCFRIWYLNIKFPQMHYNKISMDKQNLSISCKNSLQLNVFCKKVFCKKASGL